MIAPGDLGERAQEADNLVLVGPMGAGKTSIARELAKNCNRQWVDTDRMVVQRVGKSIAEIFAEEGETHFRELESEALRSLRSSRRLIVATGGGIVTRPENREALQCLGYVVSLTASAEVLFERVSRNPKRPLLHTDDPEATLRGLLEQRRDLYSAVAHITVDSSTRTHAEVAAEILEGARRFFTGTAAGAARP